MNANTSVGLGYSELIDSHRAGLQMERSFLTKSTWAQQGGRGAAFLSSLPCSLVLYYSKEDGGRWGVCVCERERKWERERYLTKERDMQRLKCALPLQLIDTFMWLEMHCFQGFAFKTWASQVRKQIEMQDPVLRVWAGLMSLEGHFLLARSHLGYCFKVSPRSGVSVSHWHLELVWIRDQTRQNRKPLLIEKLPVKYPLSVDWSRYF